MPVIRADYEMRVRRLAFLAAEMKGANLEPEAIARALHAARRALTIEFQERTPEPLRTRIRERTLRVYGNDIGPSIDFLRAQGKSWEQIIGSAVRPGHLPE
jgi:hypothetical protein